MPKYIIYIILLAIFIPIVVVAQQNAQPPTEQAAVFRFEEAPKQDEIAQQNLTKGIKAMSDGIYNIAADFFKEYRKSVDQHEPEFAIASAYLAEAFIGQNLLKEAEETLKDHETRSPGLKPADSQIKAKLAYVWGQICFMQKRYDDCLKRLLPLTGKGAEPSYIEKATILCADTYAQQGKWNELKTLLVNFLQTPGVNTKNFEIQKRLVNVHFLTGNPIAAEAILSRIEIPQKAEDQLSLNLMKTLCLAAQQRTDDAVKIFKTISAQCPETADAEWWKVLWTLSDALFEKKNYAYAEAILPLAIKTASNEKEKIASSLLLAKTQIELNKSSQAQDSLEVIRKEHPDYPQLNEVIFKLAQLYERNNSHRTAAELFAQISENKSLSADFRTKAAFEQAKSLVTDGQWKAAIDTYIKAESIADTPESKSQALFNAAELAEKINDTDHAIELYNSIADQYTKTQLAPEARIRQGNALLKQKNYEQAMIAFRQFTVDYPTHKQAPYAKLQHGAALRMGAGNQEDAKKAAAYLKEIAENMPNPDQASQALLEAYQAANKAQDFTLAQDMLNIIIERYPDSSFISQALYQRVLVKLAQADNEAAIADAEQFFKQYPQDALAPDLYILIADIYVGRSDWEKAQQLYLRLHNTQPSSKLNMMALYEAALCAYRQERPQSAIDIIQSLEMATSVTKDKKLTESEILFHAKALMLKGDVLAMQKEYEKARQAFTEVMDKVGQCDLSYAALGRQGEMCLAIAEADTTKVKDIEMLTKAEQCFLHILDKNSTASTELKDMAQYRLAVCYERQGKTEQALDAYRKLCYTYQSAQMNHVTHSSFYYTKSALAAAHLLERLGGKENLRQAMRVYQDLADTELPASKEARLRADEIRKAYAFGK
ncbi:MAG: tetratricopeptide repeat protein [Victivallales bacterium]|nr:tetratricopeptide repeat protein [Victivallales bacterium]